MSTRYTKEIMEEAVKSNVSISGVMRQLGVKWSGGQQQNIKLWIKRYDLDTSHFLGQASNRGRKFRKKTKWQEVLVCTDKDRRVNGSNLREALLDSGREYKCEGCGSNGEWLGRRITLQVDHINGDWRNNEPTNLRFLCPNCHAATENWSGGVSKIGADGRVIDTCRDSPIGRRHMLEGHGSEGSNPSLDTPKCVDCNKPISKRRKRCKSCAVRLRGTKIYWPRDEDLLELLKVTSFVEVGKMLGVSDNAIRKRLKRKKPTKTIGQENSRVV